MAEIAAVGGRAFVTALMSVGAEPVRCDTQAGFDEALKRLGAREDLRLVFLIESRAAAAPEAFEAFMRRTRAAVLALPVAPSDEHPSLEEVRHMVEQATGAKLI